MKASLPRPRPRFELTSTQPPDQVFANIKDALAGDPRVAGLVLLPERVELSVAAGDRQVWSPQLGVVLEADGTGTRLQARFGPMPTVWTLYVALYAVTLIMALLCVAYGVAQLTAGNTPFALYFAPVALACAGLVFGASYVGQGLGSDQMYVLRAFLERCATQPVASTESASVTE